MAGALGIEAGHGPLILHRAASSARWSPQLSTQSSSSPRSPASGVGGCWKNRPGVAPCFPILGSLFVCRQRTKIALSWGQWDAGALELRCHRPCVPHCRGHPSRWQTQGLEELPQCGLLNLGPVQGWRSREGRAGNTFSGLLSCLRRACQLWWGCHSAKGAPTSSSLTTHQLCGCQSTKGSPAWSTCVPASMLSWPDGKGQSWVHSPHGPATLLHPGLGPPW